MRQLELYMGEQQIFDLFFASVTSLAHCHPGNNRDPGNQLTIEQCADVALEMLEVRRDVMINSHLVAVERAEAEKQADYITRKAREEEGKNFELF